MGEFEVEHDSVRSMTKSADGRFEIIVHREDDDSYFYSDTDYSWYVRSVETGDELASFSGSSSSGRSGSDERGTRTVRFSESSDVVEATNVDGTINRIELPAGIDIVDGGRGVVLTYRDGRTDSRKRNRVVVTGKSGRPVFYPLVDDPDDS